MRIFRNMAFTRFAKKSRISDVALCKAVMNAERGLIDAALGGSVIKQRVAREGEGKSGGFHTMILFKTGTRAFFVHGFAKKKMDNISDSAKLEKTANLSSFSSVRLRTTKSKSKSVF